MSTQAERRRQIGANNKNERQASGRAMRDDMRALAEPSRVREPMPVVPKRGAMAAVRGRGVLERAAPSTGGGIASPLTETPDTREYYSETVVMPADGYFVYSVKAVKKLTLTDADNNPVEINLAEPDYNA